MNLEALFRSLKQVHGIARSSESGEVLESTGKFDHETLCAVSAVAANALSEVSDLLSAGRLTRWYYVTEQSTYYASEHGAERVVAAGDSLKNPETISRTLDTAR